MPVSAVAFFSRCSLDACFLEDKTTMFFRVGLGFAESRIQCIKLGNFIFGTGVFVQNVCN